MPRDRFLTGILIGIGALVILALVLFFIRRGQMDYGEESTPDGLLRNYILAVQNGDYERAFGYVYVEEGGPDFLRFQREMIENQGRMTSSTSVEIDGVHLADDGQSAVVQVTLLRGSSNPFESAYRDVQTASLVKAGNGWKIYAAPYPFWGSWYLPAPEKLLPTAVSTP